MEVERHADDDEESTDFLLLTYILGMCYLILLLATEKLLQLKMPL